MNVMNGSELKSLRKLFFLEVAEAAKEIGGVEDRTWRRWEDGSRKVPGDVIEVMQQLALTRQELLDFEPSPDDPMYKCFDTLDEHAEALGARSVIKWRMAQSVSAQIFSEEQAAIWRGEEVVSDGEREA